MMTDAHLPATTTDRPKPQIATGGAAQMSLIGDNNPPGPDAVFRSRIVTLNKRLANLLKMEATEAVAAALRDVVADARKLELDLEAAKKTDKQPHLDANTAIEAEYRPLVSTAGEIKAEARKALDAFLKAEEDRLEREAAETLRRAEEALAKAAVVQAEAEEDPFADPEEAARAARLANIAADHAERQAEAGASIRGASGARAAVLRSYWSVKVLNAEMMVAHFSNDRDVIAAATKAANAFVRATRGTQPIAGCEIIEERRSA